MHAHEIRVSGGSERVSAIRWELFVFRDVRDVVATDTPDVLYVIHRGEPDTRAWTETLCAAGFSVNAGARV